MAEAQDLKWKHARPPEIKAESGNQHFHHILLAKVMKSAQNQGVGN
jgi:hypothetical protein